MILYLGIIPVLIGIGIFFLTRKTEIIVTSKNVERPWVYRRWIIRILNAVLGPWIYWHVKSKKAGSKSLAFKLSKLFIGPFSLDYTSILRAAVAQARVGKEYQSWISPEGEVYNLEDKSDYTEPLRKLLDSLEFESLLHPFGRIMYRQKIVSIQ
jgi:hypothetical protein